MSFGSTLDLGRERTLVDAGPEREGCSKWRLGLEGILTRKMGRQGPIAFGRECGVEVVAGERDRGGGSDTRRRGYRDGRGSGRALDTGGLGRKRGNRSTGPSPGRPPSCSSPVHDMSPTDSFSGGLFFDSEKHSPRHPRHGPRGASQTPEALPAPPPPDPGALLDAHLR